MTHARYAPWRPPRPAPVRVTVARSSPRGIPLYRTSTEYVVHRADGWRAVGDPINCEVSTRQRWKKDVVIFRESGDCFAGADRLRLAVRMSDSRGGPTVVDWVTGRRVFTDWLAAGDPDAGS